LDKGRADMAVGFQRRNRGVLMDLPQFGGDGTEAYVDYAGSAVADATAEAPAEEEAPVRPARGEVLPALSGPEADLARTEAAARALIEQADRQRKAAGNPLNRILSGIGGVINAPFAFLDAAFSGGDMSQVTAPFRPQQNADMRFQKTVLGIQDTLSKIRENYAQMGASNASAIRTGLQTSRDEEQAAYNTLGQTTSAMLYMDPTARRQRLPTLIALARRYGERYPGFADSVQEIINNGFDNATLANYAAMSTDEGARARGNEFLYGTKQTPLGDGLAVITSARPDVAPQVISRDTPTVTAPPPITGYGPSAAPPPAIDFSKMTNEQLDAYIEAQGGN
jgi:hypothetical protein